MLIKSLQSIGIVLLVLVTMTSVVPVQAVGDTEQGRIKAQICIGCHNIANYSTAFPEVYKVPRIQGQSAEYIKYALQEYTAGNRYPAELNKLVSMPAIATTLTDQDIEDLAAYYSSLGK